MNRRIRAHGNFAEFVPLALLEARGAGPGLMHALAAPLLVLLAAAVALLVGSKEGRGTNSPSPFFF